MGRKQKEYHFIYKTTCIINNKFYVGMHSTDNLEDGYIGSGKRLWYSINKYGRENFTFEILEQHPNRDELKKREKELVNEETLKDNLCLNLKLGGTGGFTDEEHRKLFLTEGVKNGRKKTDELLKIRYGGGEDWSSKFSSYISKKAWENPEYREKKLKQINWSGKKHSDETKKKLSELRKGTGIGSSNSQFGSCWITNEKENKKIKKGDLIPDGWRLGRKISI